MALLKLFNVVQAVHLLVRKAGNQSLCLAICRLQVRRNEPGARRPPAQLLPHPVRKQRVLA